MAKVPHESVSSVVCLRPNPIFPESFVSPEMGLVTALPTTR